MADNRTIITISSTLKEKDITDIKTNRVLIRTADGKLLEVVRTKKVTK